jgi:hypothetical protein
MRRKAFLIGSPFIEGTPNYLPGVTPDVVNMKKHLQSLSGGAWNDDEITVFENPTKNKLRSEMQGYYDFVIIQYSGHGFEYSTSGTYLDINPYENISLEELHGFVQSSRRYYFLDSCRGIVREPITESRKAFSMDSMNAYDYYRVAYRKKYESIIEKCEFGTSLIYSCSLNESAEEDPQGRGGIFTLSYLRSSTAKVDWGKYASIKDIYETAKTRKLIDYPLSTEQHPTMKPERRINYFPFVI